MKIDATNAALEQACTRLLDVLDSLEQLELDHVRIGLLELYAVLAELALNRRDAAFYLAGVRVGVAEVAS